MGSRCTPYKEGEVLHRFNCAGTVVVVSVSPQSRAALAGGVQVHPLVKRAQPLKCGSVVQSNMSGIGVCVWAALIE